MRRGGVQRGSGRGEHVRRTLDREVRHTETPAPCFRSFGMDSKFNSESLLIEND